MTQQKSLKALLLALVFVFAACKGESPTAPPPGGGTGGGNNPPTTGIAVTLTASNANPVVDSPVVITAAVTVNGAAAPNGTAVEFVSTGGSFSATEVVTALLRTTTNGSSSVELRSTVAGVIRVQATVGNVSRTVDVTFKVSPTIPPPTSQAPTITSVTPSIGIPSGGQRVTIIGKNFKEPVKVLFDTGAPLPVETLVISRTDTQLEVFTPSVNLGVGQQLLADIIVITQAGTATEARAELEDGFTFRLETLTPRISTTTPNSGPVTGGTRVTIHGDGFQSPVQVLFDAGEARVVSVDFSQIIVEAPAGRDTSPAGSGTVTGPVDITVRNINSQTSTTLIDGFRYVAALDVTSFRPLTGAATGGTEVVIEGIGFLSPIDVIIAGQRATPISVTGTRLLVLTAPLPSPCASTLGPIVVTNVNNGDFEIFGDAGEEDTFQYVSVPPVITSVAPLTVAAGGNLVVTVRDPGVGPLGSGDIRFLLDGRTLIPSPDRVTVGSGTQAFSMAVPLSGFTFPTVACDLGGGSLGTQLGPINLTLTFRNLSTGCTDTASVNVVPPPSLPNPCVGPAQATVTSPATTSCPGLSYGNVSMAGAPVTQDIVITNTAPAGSGSLVVSDATVTSGGTDFTVDSSALPETVPPGSSVSIPVTFDPSVAGARTGNVRITTSDPFRPTINVCVSGNGVP